jgi:glycerol-3-phosphate acyltransferase PlsY
MASDKAYRDNCSQKKWWLSLHLAVFFRYSGMQAVAFSHLALLSLLTGFFSPTALRWLVTAIRCR